MNQSNKGYIYIRNHPFYESHSARKLGKASNIPDRDSLYATSEITRGHFEVILEVAICEMGAIERLLQRRFRAYQIYRDAGTEFYNKSIVAHIEPFLSEREIRYRKLSDMEIDELARTARRREASAAPTLHPLSKFKKTGRQPTPLYTPRTDQTVIVEKASEYFQRRDKGVLVLMCGVGKTLISLWIAQRLNAGTILIGVPNLLLLQQWEEVICALFQGVPYALVSGGVHEEQLAQFLERSRKTCIVITTYSSAYKVYNAATETRFTFQMKLLDEVHHLTSTNMRASHTTKKYIQMLNIPSEKQLSLTATLKLLEADGGDDGGGVVSNDNVNYFGDIIHRKCLLEAIVQNIVCDYAIQTIITDEEKLEQQLMRFRITEENDKRLFLSAFASLKSISDGHSHHLLVYSNNKDNSMKLVQFIQMLLGDNYFDISGFYYSNYHSEMNRAGQKEILARFKAAPSGIIACVYCLGEGWDFPLLDGVVFAENMSSNIRIVQSALRASRKNKDDAEKRTKIILPILNRDDWLEDGNNPDLKKVREVIYQMGLEDETIAQKIKVFRMDIEPVVRPKTAPQHGSDHIPTGEFGEYEDELTNQLRLKTVRRTSLGTTYERARKIVAEKKLRNKEAYYALCKRDNRLPADPETVFKGKFTNWIDYLGIERVYYDLDTCKKKAAGYLRTHPEIRANYLDLSGVCAKLCELDAEFPPNGLWTEYFSVNDLREIIVVETKRKRLGVLI